MVRLVVVCVAFLFCGLAHGQDWKRALNWYFGDSIGLSFATIPPTVVSDGAMYALEGCATISDTAGNLLFYTNGQSVWNRQHQLMLNGTGLLGAQSSTQAAIIVPHPGNDSLFYIFTTGGYLRYSVVNINKSGGYGAVVEKNNDLIRSQTEKLAATHHANGTDVWVTTHGYNNNLFYTYLVTKTGVIACPVISEIGSVMGPSSFSTQGELRFSPSGNLAGISFFDYKFCELLKFDKQSGLFFQVRKINTSTNYPYGICFSLSEDHVYISERDKFLVEYQIDSFNEQYINNSRRIIYTSNYIDNGLINWRDAIYFGIPNSNYLGYFIPPQNGDTLTEVFDSAVNISPGRGTYNFLNFISSYFRDYSVDFKYGNDCSDTYRFESIDTFTANTFTWKFIKAGQVLNSLNGKSISYQFPDTGSWEVRLIASNGVGQTDSVSKAVLVEVNEIEIGADTIVCSDSLLMDAGEGHCYLWSDNTTDRYLNAKISGTYSVKVITKNLCAVYDTITIVLDKHAISVPLSRSGDTLYTSTGFKKYQWYKNGLPLLNDTLTKLTVTNKATYKVWVLDSGHCSDYSTYYIVDSLTALPKMNKGDILVYPNPSASDKGFYIKSESLIEHIEIHSIDGRLAHREDPMMQEWYINTLQKGTYLLTINHLYHFKIIVH